MDKFVYGSQSTQNSEITREMIEVALAEFKKRGGRIKKLAPQGPTVTTFSSNPTVSPYYSIEELAHF